MHCSYNDDIHFHSQLSTKLLQDGNHDQLERVMGVKEKLQQHELEAAEAEMDAEEAEQARFITNNSNDDIIRQAKDIQQDILNTVSVHSPPLMQLVVSSSGC